MSGATITMTCTKCKASITDKVAAVLAWDADHRKVCPA